MKKSLISAALGALLCFSSFTSVQAQTLRVGTHPTFAPFEFTDSQGKVIGFDIDVIKAIAEANGDDIVIESMPFDGLIPSLITGNIDLIIAGMTITDARLKRVDFSDGYYNSNLSILVRKSDASTLNSIEALKDKPICVQIGTTGHNFANTISQNIKALNNEPDAILELNNGGCDAVINDRPVNLYYLNKARLENIHEFVAPEFTRQVDSFGIAMRKGDDELVKKINQGLQTITLSGDLDQIHIKWFGIPGEEELSEKDALEQKEAELAEKNADKEQENQETTATSQTEEKK